MKQHTIVIIGGGTAGIMVAAQLKRADKNLDIAIVEPSDKHYYQPAWTLVGAGDFKMEDTIRKEADYIPKGVTWIKDFATALHPEKNTIATKATGDISYEYLVVAPGLVMNIEGLPGLKEGLEKGNVCSNYTDPEHTWEVLKNFKGGNAVFTQPTTPIKCGGAPQKIMYLAEDYFRKNGLRDKTNVVFATPGSVIFGVKEFARTLNSIITERDIIFKTYYSPVRIDAEKNIIYYQYSEPGQNACVVTEDNKLNEEIIGTSEIAMPYDMLHIAPPQQAPDFIRHSSIVHTEGNNKGWVNVDINTLQNPDFPNVFALGDVAALPTAKTGAAIRKQAPVVADNLLHMITSNNLGAKKYEGYSSCPLITGYGKMVLAEFKYNNVRDSDKLLSTFFDTTKELWPMWILKKYGLPYLYWNQMLRGKM
ncbi:MAG: NAD(P)/FAD-dependent oxidoreductase [Schleiferiaceae bacterium]|nr:NAD(P)/FAD-dependent oxidoreductase [Schleiferiaceae bacterium]